MVICVHSEGLSAFVQFTVKLETSCTPLGLYRVLPRGYSYLLESVEKEERHARFSFVGSDPEILVSLEGRTLSVKELQPTPLTDLILERSEKVCPLKLDGGVLKGEIQEGFDSFDALRAAIPLDLPFVADHRFDRHIFLGGAMGYLAYDLVYDTWLDIPHPPTREKDAEFMLTTHTFLFDHLTGETYLIFTPLIQKEEALEEIRRELEAKAEKLAREARKAEETTETKTRRGDTTITANMDQEEFESAVKKAKKHIYDGDILQVVLSRRYELELDTPAVELYQRLREVNPSPYMYLFEFGDTAVIGASPETLLTVHQDKLTVNPIAGTCPRGKTREEDQELARRMLEDEKERAEHVMLVDLGRNDVRMVSRPGSVKVESYMDVLRYSHVQHIESTVTGMLRPGCDQFDAARAIFPAGTLSGAPKIRAMEIIHDLEKTPRGIYGGGAGYFSFNRDADFAIVIRTIIKKGKKVQIQAGAGIVADSQPEREYLETERKMAAMLKTIQQ